MTHRNKTTTPAGSSTARRWLPLTAITCALLSPGLWADEARVDPVLAAPAAPPQASEQASAATMASDPTAAEDTAAPQTDDPSRAALENPAPVAETTNPYADWKPPKMPEPMPFSTQKLDPEVVKTLKQRWGVELLGIRQSGAGMFLDFRFRVLDVDKSLPLFDHRIKPYLVAEKSEIKLPIPQAAKVGSFRPTNRGKNIKADKNYYMLFANPDRHVKVGEKVSVIIGDFKVEHLTVQ